VEGQIRFVVDVRKETLLTLETLLASHDFVSNSNRPPTQDKECIVVSSLNLLKLQVVNIFDGSIINEFPDPIQFL